MAEVYFSSVSPAVSHTFAHYLFQNQWVTFSSEVQLRTWGLEIGYSSAHHIPHMECGGPNREAVENNK